MPRTNNEDLGGAPEDGTIKSLETTFDIVEYLQRAESATLTEITRETAYSKSTVYNHLRTLTRNGFATKTDNTYRIGHRFLDLGGSFRHTVPGTRTIKLKIRELAMSTGEVGFFTIEKQGRPIILFREAGRHGVPTRSRVGKRLYMNQIAAGKAILASYPEERVRAIINWHGLPRATENTITDEATLFETLDEIRERGYAESIGEATEGLQAVGVTVTGQSGSVIGGCALAGPIHRIGDKIEEKGMINQLRGVVNEIELSISYS